MIMRLVLLLLSGVTLGAGIRNTFLGEPSLVGAILFGVGLAGVLWFYPRVEEDL